MEWLRAEVDTSNEKVGERVHSVFLDMSSKFLTQKLTIARIILKIPKRI